VRVLLDECLPRRLKRELVGHDAKTVPEMGWASKRNGELLALAAARRVSHHGSKSFLSAGLFRCRYCGSCAGCAEQQH